jgi:Leucine-rich repeat (LRR) protein
MNTTIKNFFNYLEIIDGKKIPLRIKIIYFPEEFEGKSLKVNGTLNLSFSPIERVPDNLIIVGDLDLSFTKISKIPLNLVVYGNLNLNSTPYLKIGTTKNYWETFPGVRGYIYH